MKLDSLLSDVQQKVYVIYNEPPKQSSTHTTKTKRTQTNTPQKKHPPSIHISNSKKKKI